MKKILSAILVSLFVVGSASADCLNNNIRLGFPSDQAAALCAQTVTSLTAETGNVTATAGNLVATAGDLVLTAGAVVQTRVITIPAYTGVRGATSSVGWVVSATDKGLATLAHSATNDTLVIPIVGLGIGDTVTAFKVTGQIDSAGNTATLDADLRKLTPAAAGTADASIGAITQVSVTADTAIASGKTLATPEVIASGETLYLLVTGTTAATTDIEVASVEVTVLTGN